MSSESPSAGHDLRKLFFRLEEGAWHSTYRIMKAKGLQPEVFERYWEPLRQAGCSYEEGPGRLLAVDVPPRADIQHVYGLLEQGEQAQVWHFEEGHQGHPGT